MLEEDDDEGEAKMDRDELIENLRTTLLWETVGAHIERRNEADVILQKAGVENVAAECAEIQDSTDFFATDVCERRIVFIL